MEETPLWVFERVLEMRDHFQVNNIDLNPKEEEFSVGVDELAPAPYCAFIRQGSHAGNLPVTLFVLVGNHCAYRGTLQSAPDRSRGFISLDVRALKSAWGR